MKFFFTVVLMTGYFNFTSCADCVLESDYICTRIPQNYFPSISSVVFVVSDIGVINSSVFTSPSLASVSSLSLGKAGITQIQTGAFRSFQQLKKLNLYSNRLTQISSSWLSRPDILENLTMFENEVQKIDVRTLSEFSNLIALNLARNKIAEIASGSFQELHKLAVLDLSGNRLSYVSKEAFRSLRSTKLRLDGNPWDCSCQLKDFREFLQDMINASLLENYLDVTCETPPALKGTPVWNISELNCLSPSTPKPLLEPLLNIGVPILMGILAILCCVVCLTFLYKRNQEKKQVNPGGGRREEPGLPKARGAVNVVACQPGKSPQGPDAHRSGLRKGRAKSACAVLVRSPLPEHSLRKKEEEAGNKGQTNFQAVYYCTAIAPGNGRRTTENEVRGGGGEGPNFPPCGPKGITATSANYLCEDNMQCQTKIGNVFFTVENPHSHKLVTETNPSSHGGENLPYLIIDTQPAKLNVESMVQCHPYPTNKPVLFNPVRVKRMSTWPPAAAEWKNNQVDKNDVQKHFLKLEEESEMEHNKEGRIVVFSIGNDTQKALHADSAKKTLQGGEAQKALQGDGAQKALQGGESQKALQGGEAQKALQGGEAQKALQRGKALKALQGGESQKALQGGESQKALQRGKALKALQGGESQKALQGGEAQKALQRGKALKALQGGEVQKALQEDKHQKALQGAKESEFSSKNDGIDGAEPQIDWNRRSTNEEMARRSLSPQLLTIEKADNGKCCKTSRGSQRQDTLPKKRSQQRQRTSQARDREDDEYDQPPVAVCDSPGDENLLEHNEYAFIDLLHEVVENQGRWTRDRWKQTHKARQKCKQQGES